MDIDHKEKVSHQCVFFCVFLDENYENHNFLIYDNNEPYWVQYTECIKSIGENFVIYSQDDFFLYDDVELESLQKYVDFLNICPDPPKFQ